MDELSKEELIYILNLIISNCFDESKEKPTDEFNEGRKFAYYEVLDSIRNQLDVREVDLSEYGLENEILEWFNK